MVEAYLRTQLGLLLDVMLRCLQQGDEDDVELGSVEKAPLTNLELARSLSKAMEQPDNVRTIYHERPGERPHRFTTTEWSIGPWMCVAGYNKIVVRAKDKPSAHTILTAMAVRDKLKTMDVSDLVGHGRVS